MATTEQDPPWLATALDFVGVGEISGHQDNPVILEWPKQIAAKFPEMTKYCANYVDDEIAWCGVFTGVVFAVHDIRPPFGATDVDRLFYAASWRKWGEACEPKRGCILVFDHHVCLCLEVDGDKLTVVGGNQGGDASHPGGAVTVRTRKRSELLASRWPSEVAARKVALPLPAGDYRKRIAAAIVDWEAVRDAQHHIKVIAATGGGGAAEYAGIASRYHPKEVAQIQALVAAGKHAEAEGFAGDFVVSYTNPVAAWTRDPAVEAALRDCCFNRGPTGAARIFQRAVGADNDGEVGPLTLAAAARMTPAAIVEAIRPAREWLERQPHPVGAGRDESSKYWNGLVNRWNKQLAFSRTLVGAAELPPSSPQPEIITPGEGQQLDLLALLRAALGGSPMPTPGQPGQIDLAAIITAIAPLIGGARPALPPPPPPPPPGAQGFDADALAAVVARTVDAALERRLGIGARPPAATRPIVEEEEPSSAPPVGPAPQIIVQPTPPTAASNTVKNWSVGIGGAILSLIASKTGMAGDPVGPASTMTGALGFLLPLLGSSLGAYAVPVNAILRVGAGLFKLSRAPKTP